MTCRHRQVRVLLVACMLPSTLVAASCDCLGERRTHGQTEMLLEPPADRSSLKEGELTVRDIMDHIHFYFPTVSRDEMGREVGEQEKTLTPRQDAQRQAWLDRRGECEALEEEWHALIKEVNAQLPAYDMKDGTWPLCTSREVVISRHDEPPLADGVPRSALVVRVSFLAPVWEAYESSSVIRMVGPQRDRVHHTKNRRSHDIASAYEPVADAFGRAINAWRGPHHRLYEDVTGIRLLNVIDWSTEWYASTVGELLFSAYAW